MSTGYCTRIRHDMQYCTYCYEAVTPEPDQCDVNVIVSGVVLRLLRCGCL